MKNRIRPHVRLHSDNVPPLVGYRAPTQRDPPERRNLGKQGARNLVATVRPQGLAPRTHLLIREGRRITPATTIRERNRHAKTWFGFVYHHSDRMFAHAGCVVASCDESPCN